MAQPSPPDGPTAGDPVAARALNELCDYASYMKHSDARLRPRAAAVSSRAASHEQEATAGTATRTDWRRTNDFQEQYRRLFVARLDKQSAEAANALLEASNRLSKCAFQLELYRSYAINDTVPPAMRFDVMPRLPLHDPLLEADTDRQWEEILHDMSIKCVTHVRDRLETCDLKERERELNNARQRLIDLGPLAEEEVDRLCSLLQLERIFVAQHDSVQARAMTEETIMDYGCTPESYRLARMRRPFLQSPSHPRRRRSGRSAQT